jgi:hypothetical protein
MLWLRAMSEEVREFGLRDHAVLVFVDMGENLIRTRARSGAILVSVLPALSTTMSTLSATLLTVIRSPTWRWAVVSAPGGLGAMGQEGHR